jgi:hypothetical protein
MIVYVSVSRLSVRGGKFVLIRKPLPRLSSISTIVIVIAYILGIMFMYLLLKTISKCGFVFYFSDRGNDQKQKI